LLDPKTNRCYVRLDSFRTDKRGGYQISELLAGQTQEMSASAKNEYGRKSGFYCDKSGTTTVDGDAGGMLQWTSREDYGDLEEQRQNRRRNGR